MPKNSCDPKIINSLKLITINISEFLSLDLRLNKLKINYSTNILAKKQLTCKRFFINFLCKEFPKKKRKKV